MHLHLTPAGWVLCAVVPAAFGLTGALADGWAPWAVLVVGLVAVGVVATAPERARLAGLRERAATHGWAYAPSGEDPGVSRVPPLDSPGTVRNLLRGRWRDRDVLAYERTHRTRRDPEDPDTERVHEYAVVAVTGRPATTVVLDPPPRRWLPPVPGTAPPTDFDARWTVLHGAGALTPVLRERLLAPDARGLHVRCTDTHVVAVRPRPFDADALERTLDLLCDLADLAEQPEQPEQPERGAGR